MKKFFLSIGLLVTAATLMAANPPFATVEYSFLNAQSIQVTNTLGVTNLVSPFLAVAQGVVYGAATNASGIIFTNLAGKKIEVPTAASDGTTTTNFWSQINLLGEAPLPNVIGYREITNGISTTYVPEYLGQGIYTRIVGGSGANAAVTFIFEPVYGSDDNYGSILLGTAETGAFTISVTATTTTEVRTWTPLNWADLGSKFVGATKIRLRRIKNADTDASSAVQVLQCSLIGARQ